MLTAKPVGLTHVGTGLCVCVHVCGYACIYIYVCMYVCMYVCVRMSACMWVCMYIYVCMYVCTCVCMYVYYVHMYVCVHVCIYVFIYVHMCAQLKVSMEQSHSWEANSCWASPYIFVSFMIPECTLPFVTVRQSSFSCGCWIQSTPSNSISLCKIYFNIYHITDTISVRSMWQD
jgi:nuclear pore complex protein Nup62